MKRLQQRDVRAAQTLMYKRQGRKAVTYFGLPNTAGADNADSLPQEGTGKAPIPVFAGKNRRKSSVSVTLREAQFRLENLRRQSAAMNLHNKPTTPIPAAPGRDRVQSPSKTATPTAAVSATPLLASAPPSVPSSAQKTQRSPRAQRHLVSVIPSKSPSRSPTLASSPVDNAASGQLDSVIENQEKGITLSRVSASEVPTTMSADLDGDEDNDEHDDELARLFHTLAADNSDAEDEIVVDAAETDKDDSNLENAEDNADRARRAAIVMRVLDELRNQREKISKSSSVDFTYAVDEKLASIPASTQEPGTMYFVSPIHTVMK
ncbi:hypothetical protein EON65_11140 [archaeon]|nr:MAG: hypothetical protein EON65_11140 [archaeon]